MDGDVDFILRAIRIGHDDLALLVTRLVSIWTFTLPLVLGAVRKVFLVSNRVFRLRLLS